MKPKKLKEVIDDSDDSLYVPPLPDLPNFELLSDEDELLLYEPINFLKPDEQEQV